MIVTNNGLNLMGTQYPFFYCNVGSGTLSGSLVQATGLNAFEFNVSGGGTTPASTSTRSSSAPFYFERTLYWSKDNIEAGATLREISIGVSPSNEMIACIDRLRDSSGNPTDIQVLAGDSLRVTAKIRLYANATPITGTIAANQDMPQQAFTVVPNFSTWDINENCYMGNSYLSCALSTDPLDQDVTVDGSSSGVFASTQPAVWDEYVSGSYYRDATFNMGTSECNDAQIVQICTGGVIPCPIKIGLTPGFTKTSAYVASFRLRFSWARHV